MKQAAARHLPLVGADLLDRANIASWAQRFVKVAHRTPAVWGLHNYIDANRMSTKTTALLLRSGLGPSAALAAAGIRQPIDLPGVGERVMDQPAVMLYAPLHVMLWTDTDARAHLTVDRPSDQFASFGDPRITEVGVELDRKLAVLFDHLGLRVPERRSST